MCLCDRSNVCVFALLAKMNLPFKHFIFIPVCVCTSPARGGVRECVIVVYSFARQ